MILLTTALIVWTFSDDQMVKADYPISDIQKQNIDSLPEKNRLLVKGIISNIDSNDYKSQYGELVTANVINKIITYGKNINYLQYAKNNVISMFITERRKTPEEYKHKIVKAIGKQRSAERTTLRKSKDTRINKRPEHLDRSTLLRNIHKELKKEKYDVVSKFREDFLNDLETKDLKTLKRYHHNIEKEVFREFITNVNNYLEIIYGLPFINERGESEYFKNQLENASSFENIKRIVNEAKHKGLEIEKAIKNRPHALEIISKYKKAYNRIPDGTYEFAKENINKAISVFELNHEIERIHEEARRLYQTKYLYKNFEKLGEIK